MKYKVISYVFLVKNATQIFLQYVMLITAGRKDIR